jgi:hypothetical protein
MKVKNTIIAFTLTFSLFSCSVPLVKLTPDTISNYGLDQNTIKNIQCYFQTINVHTDSTITRYEPTRYIRVNKSRVVTDDSSDVKQTVLPSNSVIILKNNTPCKIDSVLENGTVLLAEFDTTTASPAKFKFKLSYRSGYSFELASDSIFYNSELFIRTPTPLIENIGLLYIDKKSIESREYALPGKVIKN